MKQRYTRDLFRALAAFFACVLTLTAIGCGRAAPARYFSYLDAPFCATLTGKINGLTFAATLKSEGREAAGDMPAFALSFTAPESLAGMEVRYHPDTGLRTFLFELEGETDGEGLGMISDLLLLERAVNRSRREAGSVVLSLDDGGELWLDGKTGLPQRATFAKEGRIVEVFVVDWQKNEYFSCISKKSML